MRQMLTRMMTAKNLVSHLQFDVIANTVTFGPVGSQSAIKVKVLCVSVSKEGTRELRVQGYHPNNVCREKGHS